VNEPVRPQTNPRGLTIQQNAETLLNQDIELPDIDYTGWASWVAVAGDVKGIIVIRDIMLAEMQNLANTIHIFGIEKVILAAFLHHISSIFVETNAG